MKYRWQLLRAGKFKLDGGSMFGLVPRVVWSKSVPSDDKGRIQVQHNCLLLEPADGSKSDAFGASPAPGVEEPGRKRAGPPKRALIETGTGDKLDAKSREIFELENRSILDALAEVNCPPESIELVAVSHLHFDHAGGLTRLPRAQEMPDWTGPGSAGVHGVKRSFPNAKIHVQRREWEDALANRSVMTRTYFRDHLELIAEQLVLHDSPRPFVTGLTPGRDELPAAPVAYRETPIAPGISVFLVPGHTWGQQAVKFVDDQGRTVVFVPDVMPTVNHLGAAYSLGYDVEPYTSMVSRRWLLEEAARNDWLLVLDHEPGNPCVRASKNPQLAPDGSHLHFAVLDTCIRPARRLASGRTA
jgi:glyoxylase-like metal-dependent hydrolase (beta-lactamase superfamily II)